MNNSVTPRNVSESGGIRPLGDDYWRELMTAGNAAFQSGDGEAALTSYTLAIKEAERLLDISLRGHVEVNADPVPALIVAASNAANVHADRSNHMLAKDVLEQAILPLRTLIMEGSVSADLRLNCTQHVSRALISLAEHMREAGIDESDISYEIGLTKTAIKRCISEIQSKPGPSIQ